MNAAKKIRGKRFDTPMIIGALCESEDEISPAIKHLLAKHPGRIAYLPFEVEGRHLKNTVACMQLMDIMGLTIAGSHQKKIVRHIPNMDRIAKAAGAIDTVARKGRSFMGHNAMGIALLDWLRNFAPIPKQKRHAVLIGGHPLMPSIKGTLKSGGWMTRGISNPRRSKPALIVAGAISRGERKKIGSMLEGSGKRCLLVDLGETKPALTAKRGEILDRKIFLNLFYLTTVRLLTSGL